MGGQTLVSSVFSLLNFAVFICHGHENNNTGDSYCACVMAPKTVVPSIGLLAPRSPWWLHAPARTPIEMNGGRGLEVPLFFLNSMVGMGGKFTI